jgi:DNA polymerase-3 subunit alpha
LDQQGQKLIDGMLKNGIDLQFAKQIWELFPPFARYGFNRSHGACYALIGYQTAYLKAHFPVEFMTGLLNADSKDIDRLSYLAAEAKKTGIEILPPDVNRSWFNFTPEGKHIRFGLAAIKNVGENIVRAIIENRGQKGPFVKFLELLYRIDHKDLNKKSLESLIKCGALDSLWLERQRALINLEEIVRFNSALKRHQRQNQVELFESAPLTERVSIKLKPAAPAAGGQKLAWEKELLGLYVSDHPLNRFRRQIAASRAQSIADLLKSDGAPRHQIAGLIYKIHKIVTKRGQPMLFAKMEDFGDTIEVIVFSDVLEKTAAAWKEDNALLVSGRLSLRDGEPKLICERVSQLLNTETIVNWVNCWIFFLAMIARRERPFGIPRG